MDFSVIIPTYKDWQRLGKCVNRLLDSDTGKITFEIIIVDNDSNHNPPGFLKGLSNVKILHEPVSGSYIARNTGAAEATGHYLAFTDADCLPDRNWLNNAFVQFKTEKCDLIGGRVDIFKAEGASETAYIYDKHTAFPQYKNVPRGHSVTANLFVKESVFRSLSGFDSSLKSGGDWEFTSRAVEADYRLVYADSVIVFHPARSSVKSIFKKQKRLYTWGYKNVRDKYGHSGVRILCSNLIRGFKKPFVHSKKPDKFSEKIILFILSGSLYLFRIAIHILLIFSFMDPEKIRE